MKAYGYIFLLLSSSYSVGGYAADDVSSCSSFIPDNHHYQIVVKYDFVHGKKMKRFVGISDKNTSQLSKEQEEKIKPFVDCIKNKMK
ncbi:hypothetical protein SFC19_06685 [Citrobacter portucalensis]|uniref:hypothetical protein n=1 Tax=Citrobacter freundii complex TaxID=1344959 RepID=UPI0006522703|nr:MULTISPECIES: hypothetical protein [Citrobacter freundii complex]QNM20326.1 hypothetical protein CXM87_09810 [Citrobacter freundii]MCX8994508.1 hypothetical protein [Citrobacter portucalensis]QNM25785.1 hypothetical protein CXM82_11080 [Citrobacter freundii]QNM30479.1 hypothetical protein CXM80_09810 [Citrobacter freundii]QNM35715.1 hypothetical protein CXM81_09810 [Citrobacter freundii]